MSAIDEALERELLRRLFLVSAYLSDAIKAVTAGDIREIRTNINYAWPTLIQTLDLVPRP